jgi:hypothetical protein
VVRRFAAPVIAAAALLASVGGLGGVASLLLLAAIVAGAVRLVDAVGLAAEGRGERLGVGMAAAGLVCLVGAGVTHVTLLVVGLFACVAVELLGEAEVHAEPAAVEPVELRRAA